MEIKTVRTSGVAPHIPVIEPLSIINNGTYTAPTGVDGYSPVTVDVQEQPWQPLEDGYSNFWFELTDDTLSPWLNFSAKNADATIDWGDGSGEVALDTLTPTHTYSKAGRYVVKCKGVTAIAQQQAAPYDNATYNNVLKRVELNSEVTNAGSYRACCGLKSIALPNGCTVNSYAFLYCGSLEEIINLKNISTLGAVQTFQNCFSLKNLELPQTSSIGQSMCALCYSLSTLIIPSTITSIGNSAFNGCYALAEIHVQATTPPTLGTNPFSNIASNYVIYVPVGTGDTYKAAWSAYADHILEEGEVVTRAMQRKFKKEAEKSDNDEDKR